MKRLGNGRRLVLQSGILSLVSLPLLGRNMLSALPPTPDIISKPHGNYPSVSLDLVAEIVGVSHANLDRLKQLVDNRPELSKASWDWGFGDVESAIGAASHTGRADIASYLIQRGASPTIFTMAMLGKADAVKATIDAMPGIQQIAGPHDISLLQHAKTGMETGASNKDNGNRTIDYLLSLGDAVGKQHPAVAEADKKIYLGDYRYGSGEGEGFSVRLNMRGTLSLGRLGKFGGALLKTGHHSFTYNGAPSVHVIFTIADQIASAVTIIEPGFEMKATRVLS